MTDSRGLVVKGSDEVCSNGMNVAASEGPKRLGYTTGEIWVVQGLGSSLLVPEVVWVAELTVEQCFISS